MPERTATINGSRRRAAGIVPPPASGVPQHRQSTCLSDIFAKQVQWHWQERLPLGEISKTNKSSVSRDLAARILNGRPMPEGSQGVLGGFLFIAYLTTEVAQLYNGFSSRIMVALDRKRHPARLLPLVQKSQVGRPARPLFGVAATIQGGRRWNAGGERQSPKAHPRAWEAQQPTGTGRTQVVQEGKAIIRGPASNEGPHGERTVRKLRLRQGLFHDTPSRFSPIGEINRFRPRSCGASAQAPFSPSGSSPRRCVTIRRRDYRTTNG